MAAAIDSGVLQAHVAHPVTKRRRPLVIGIGVLLVGAALAWWFLGGTYLKAAGGGYGVPVPLGQDASFGVVVQTDDGGQVTLDSVSAQVSPGATVTWSVYEAAPGSLGFGAWHGPLAPRWPTVPVDGFNLASTGDPANGSTWVVGTVHADTPGVYRVSDVNIDYRSGWRSRTTGAQTTACVMVYPAGSTFDSLAAADDPLLADYDACTAQP